MNLNADGDCISFHLMNSMSKNLNYVERSDTEKKPGMGGKWKPDSSTRSNGDLSELTDSTKDIRGRKR